eukprot:3323265-Prymnesium_polylepis.2
MLVRGGTRVPRQDRQDGTDRVAAVVERRAVGRRHVAALLAELLDAQLWVAGEAAVAGLGALCRGARPAAVDLQRVRLWVVADDASQHAHGNVVGRARADPRLHHVVVDEVAR